MPNQNYVTKLIVLSLMLFLQGCSATRPPVAEIEAARQAIAMADELGAEVYAPLEMRFSRERFEAAKSISTLNAKGNAFNQAVEATLNAELAIAKTRAALARDKLARAREKYDRLEVEAVQIREGGQ